jgi:hypothetical protein
VKALQNIVAGYKKQRTEPSGSALWCKLLTGDNPALARCSDGTDLIGLASATIATHLDRVFDRGLLASDILALAGASINFGVSHDTADQSGNSRSNEKCFLSLVHNFVGFNFYLRFTRTRLGWRGVT